MLESHPQGMARLLDRLDLDSAGILIDLPREERQQVLAHFDRRTPSPGASTPLPASIYPRILHRGETVLEPQGRLAEAAVLYALAQDDCLERGDGLVGLAFVFRFKLGHVLDLLDEASEANRRRCIDFALRTIDLVKAAEGAGKLDCTASRALMYKLQHWLGSRYDELGQWQLALDAHLVAWSQADEPCDRIDCLLAVAGIHEGRGEDQQAYQRLLQCREDIALVEDSEIREYWQTRTGVLYMKLGGNLLALAGSFKTSVAHGFGEMLGRGLTEEKEVDLQRLDSLLAAMPMPDEQGDPDLRHARILAQALAAIALEQPDRAQALVEEAERLESRLAGPALEKSRFEREILLARWEGQSGDPAEVVRRLTSLLPEAEIRLDAEGKMTFLGYLLEALAKERSPRIQEIRDQSTQLLTLFEELMERQPGGAARRRFREMKQRPLESALFALLAASRKLGFGQEMLSRAWNLIMTTRNPDLRMISPDARVDWIDREIRDLEKDLHAALRDQLAGFPDKRPACWEEPLDKLQEHEIAVARAPRPRSNAVLGPPSRGVGLAFFRFRDLFHSKPMLALISLDGRLSYHRFPEGEMESWGGELPIWSWLPEELVEITRKPDRNPLSWSFFPDAELHKIRVEMLRFSEEMEIFLGETVPMRLCLRSSVPDIEERVDLSRGWIGLGGVPSFGIFMPELQNAAKEVVQIRDLLVSREVPTGLLLGEEATVGHLSSCLTRMHPAVVHLAVHGHSEEDYPEACALILAPDPEQGGYELLPFRRILDLPLRDVELVVLSACSSLVGPSRRSAGMEGLAWAFLQAGAKQVIATRDEANDDAASAIMGALYRHLLEYPVAEALRRTRKECLDLGVDPVQVSLWSVWS
jgi:hypothetical protein